MCLVVDNDNQPSQLQFPSLAVELAQTGDLGLSPSQYESLRVSRMEHDRPTRQPNLLRLCPPVPSSLSLVLEQEMRLNHRLVLDLGLHPVPSPSDPACDQESPEQPA